MNTPEFDDLSTPHQIIQILKLVGYPKLRFKAMSFAHTYSEPCQKNLAFGDRHIRFLEKIRKSEKFKRWLEYILTFGNYMNGTHNLFGGVYGFKMDTLSKICEVKTFDQSRNLLEYIIEIISKKEKDRDLLDYPKEILDDIKGCKYKFS